MAGDFFTVPRIRFQGLYVFLVLAHERRRIVHFAVTAHPTRRGQLNKRAKRSPGMMHLNICFGIAIASSERACRSGEGDGHETSASGATVTMAACLRRTDDWDHSPQVPRSHDRIQ